MRDEDEVLNMIHARTLQTILFFTNKGKVYSEKVYQIPLAGRTDRGVPIVNVISISPDEVITAMVAVKDFTKDGFCIMTTAKGLIKRVELEQFNSVRPSGLIAISLEKDDTLGWVNITNGSNDIIIVIKYFITIKVISSDCSASPVNSLTIFKVFSVSCLGVSSVVCLR